MITNVAHACFRVKNLEETVRFYCDVLGFEIAFEFKKEDGRRYGVYIKAGGRQFLEFFESQNVVPAFGEISFGHLCLEVDDIQATVKEIRGKGVEVSEPKLGSDQSWQAWFSDPDGNRYELHQYTAESWQAPHVK